MDTASTAMRPCLNCAMLALGLILAGTGLLGAEKNKPNPESAAVVQEAQRAGVRTAGGLLFLETEDLTWAVGIDGRNHSFVDRRNNKDYLAAPEPFMRVLKEGQWFGATSAALERGFLYVEFGDSGVWAKIHVRALPRYLTLTLTAVNDHQITSFQLAHLPLTLTRQVSSSLSSCRDEQYAAALIPLNIETTSSPNRGPHTLLVGQADQQVRLEGAAIAVIGCPTPDLLDIIEQVEIENGLPHPTLGGVWARQSPEQMKSYLFVDLSEAIADSMIEYARAGGLGYIVVYDGTWNASHGTYPVNLNNFPAGKAGLKAVSNKIHAAGLKFGMHNLDMVVEKNSSLVHPVPAAGFLMYPDRQRFLATDIGPDDTFVPTTTSPAGLLSKEDKSRYHGRDLRLGDEIVVYGELQTAPPYGFKNCTRGAHGTTANAHRAGAAIDNFSEFIGFYRPDVKGPLYDRIARAEAEALDRFEFDYIYPDGIGENLGYWPEGPAWYINNLLVSKLYHYTRREVMFAHGPISNYSWHVFSRGNTTDYVNTGVIQHFDHASLAGAAASHDDLQPFEFGWFGYFTHSLGGDASRPREMEYAWCKALAHGAAMSLETTKAALDANGRTGEIFARIKAWEDLKLAGYFPEAIRKQLQAPGEEFALEQQGGKWEVVPVRYSPDHYVPGAASDQHAWTFDNPYPDQPLWVSIQARPQLAAYGDSANVVLLTPGPLKLYTEGSGPLGSPQRHTAGLEYRIETVEAAPPSRGQSFEVRAFNGGTVPLGWGCAEIILDNPQDLRAHRALGAWVEGDSSGAYLHFVLEDAGRWCVRDYYVRLDFQGWKYIEMSRWARGEVYDFAFPYSNYWAIRGIDFNAISRVYVFLTGLAPGTAARARFSRLEALHQTPLAIHKPTIEINGTAITFPVSLQPDGYLEYEGTGPVRVFDADGFTQAEATLVGDPPTLRQGINQISFSCNQAPDQGETTEVTLITRGKPLR